MGILGLQFSVPFRMPTAPYGPRAPNATAPASVAVAPAVALAARRVALGRAPAALLGAAVAAPQGPQELLGEEPRGRPWGPWAWASWEQRMVDMLLYR